MSGPDEKNDNWTRSLEKYDWFPDVELGVPEPPLFYQESEQDCMTELPCVYNTDPRLSLIVSSCTDFLGTLYATVVTRALTRAAWCAATVLKEGGQTASTSVRIVGHPHVHGRKIISVIFPLIH